MKKIAAWLTFFSLPLLALNLNIPNECEDYQNLKISEISKNDFIGIYCKELIVNLGFAQNEKKDENKIFYLGKAILSLKSLKKYIEKKEFLTIEKEYEKHIKQILKQYPNEVLAMTDGVYIYNISLAKNGYLKISKRTFQKSYDFFEKNLSNNKENKKIDNTAYVIGDNVRLRDKPSKKSKVNDLIPKYEKVKILAIPNDEFNYYYIKWNDYEGWIYKDYILTKGGVK